MAKYIKLEVRPVGPSYTHVNVTVVEQTHRSSNFGNADNGHRFQASNGVELRSFQFPEFNAGYGFTGKPSVALRGSYTPRDNDIITVPASFVPELTAAVEEYNKTFADKAPVAPAKTVAPKHIQVQAEPVGPLYNTVKVTILSQTDFCKTFGTPDKDGKGANEFVFGKVRLASCEDDAVGMKDFMPKRLQGKGLIGTFYARRSMYQTPTHSSSYCVVSAENWVHIKEAIEAYNKHYADFTYPVKGVGNPKDFFALYRETCPCHQCEGARAKAGVPSIKKAAPAPKVVSLVGRYVKRINCDNGPGGAVIGEVAKIVIEQSSTMFRVERSCGITEGWCKLNAQLLPEGYSPAKIKVGDTVVGNSKANKYGITKEGYTAKVTAVRGNYIDLDSTLKHDPFFGLDASCFDVVAPKSTSSLVGRTVERINRGNCGTYSQVGALATIVREEARGGDDGYVVTLRDGSPDYWWKKNAKLLPATPADSCVTQIG